VGGWRVGRLGGRVLVGWARAWLGGMPTAPAPLVCTAVGVLPSTLHGVWCMSHCCTACVWVCGCRDAFRALLAKHRAEGIINAATRWKVGAGGCCLAGAAWRGLPGGGCLHAWMLGAACMPGCWVLLWAQLALPWGACRHVQEESLTAGRPTLPHCI
jgi:hypothetical protein